VFWTAGNLELLYDYHLNSWVLFYTLQKKVKISSLRQILEESNCSLAFPPPQNTSKIWLELTGTYFYQDEFEKSIISLKSRSLENDTFLAFSRDLGLLFHIRTMF